MLYCKSKRKASMCKKAYLLWVVLFVIIFFSQASAEITPPEDDINGNPSIDLQQLSINELLSLQKEIQRILADKGYVQYEELDRGSKGDSVSNVQQRLKELFFYSGSITGKYDTETQKAFKQFEKYNNLTNDGKASQSDLLILFSSVALSKPTSLPVTAVTSTPDPEDTSEEYLPFSAFDYAEYFRYPEKYYGSKIVLKGKVVQVLGTRTAGYQIRLDTSGKSDIVYIYLNADPGFNILEGDRLTVYAVMRNTYTYKSILGQSITIPSANADRIKLN